MSRVHPATQRYEIVIDREQRDVLRLALDALLNASPLGPSMTPNAHAEAEILLSMFNDLPDNSEPGTLYGFTL